MRFARSDAFFPDSRLSEVLGIEYERPCGICGTNRATDGCTISGLAADFAARRRILEIVCLNRRLDGATLVPEMRKSFDAIDDQARRIGRIFDDCRRDDDRQTL